jgi:hypothetical protein
VHILDLKKFHVAMFRVVILKIAKVSIFPEHWHFETYASLVNFIYNWFNRKICPSLVAPMLSQMQKWRNEKLTRNALLMLKTKFCLQTKNHIR